MTYEDINSAKCRMCGSFYDSTETGLCTKCSDRYDVWICPQCRGQCTQLKSTTSELLPCLCSECKIINTIRSFPPEMMEVLDSKVIKRRSNHAYDFLISENGFSPSDAIQIVNYRRDELGLLDIRDREK